MKNVRRTVEFWNDQDKAFWRYNRRPLRQYVKYARRLAGDKHDLVYATDGRGDGPDGERDAPAMNNLTALAARVLRASLLWRNPRFQARSPGPMSGGTFTPLLARIETVMLNDFAEESGLYQQQRLSLLDGIAGPYMVGKTMFDFDLAVDDTIVFKGRKEAQEEDAKFVLMGVKPVAEDDEYHPAHIEQHEATLARMERGEMKVPESAMRYLKKHIAKHYDLKKYGRVAETMRNQGVHFRRINPVLFGYDVFDRDKPSWFRETYLARMEDLKENTDNSRKACEELQEIKTFYKTGDDHPEMPLQYDVHTPDPMVRVHEYIDLVDNQIVVIADGGTVPLQVRPYTMSSILPTGPYTVSSFWEHLLHNTGVPMPYMTEAHEEASSELAGINVQTCLRSLPIWWINGQYVTPEQKAKIEAGEIGEGIVFDQLPPNVKGSDAVGNLPPLEVPEQNMMMESAQRQAFQAHYGGAATMGGGDTSPTATASEVSQLARSTQADEMSSLLDDHMRRIGVTAQRYKRKFYTQDQAVDVFGEEARLQGGWPIGGFSDRDIKIDRMISVVPGSSRRNNSTIETKLLQDTYALMLQDPTVSPEEIIEVRRRLNESNGIYGIDYEASMQHVLEQRAMEAMGAGGEMAAGPDGKPTGPQSGEQRPAEQTEGTMSAQTQGMANVGGGRAGPGAVRADLKRRRESRGEVPV